MAQYIRKSAVVAEIERRIKEGDEVIKEVPSSAILGLIQAYKNVLSILNTLEVKEVDLYEELSDFIMSYRNKETGYSLDTLAKHFYELGLKAKGE